MLTFRKSDPFEVSQLLSNLPNRSSCGYDGISAKVLKYLRMELCKPLSILINKSLVEGYVPDALKLAKIVPVYKSKDKQCFTNYRPISVLPSVSKIFEKVIFKRLYNFLDKHSLIYESQYGFRPKHSTIDVILEFVNQIYKTFEENEFSVGIFLDLSKAFDTVDHQILLVKLKWY